MTIQSDDRKTSEVLTDGVTAIYDYDFPVFYGEDGGKGIEVRYVNNLGFDVVPQSSYLVLPNTENSGGSIQFQQAPISGKRLQIVGKTQVDQQLDITNHGRFQAEAIETNFDKIFAIMQEWFRSLDEEARQRISNDAQIVNQYVLDHQNIREYLEGRLNAKWAEINTFFDNLLPVFFCVMRKEIDSFVYSDSSIAEIIKRIGSLIDTNWTADFIVVAGGGTQQDVNDRIGNTWREKPNRYALHDRVMLENGDIVKSTVANNPNNPNIDMTGWLPNNTTKKTFILNPLSSSVMRVLDEKLNGEFASIKDGGAVGDGALHTLQEWVDAGLFSDLPTIQIAYPSATALTDSIDAVVIQTWVDKYKRVLVPDGIYLINKSIVIDGSGCELYGESVSTYGAGETVKTRFVHAFNGDMITLNTTTVANPRGRHRIRGIAFASDDNFSGRAIVLRSSQNHLVDLSFYKFKDGGIRIQGRSYGTYIIKPSFDQCGSNGAYDISVDIDTGGASAADYNTITVVADGIFETPKTGAISIKDSDPFYLYRNYIEPFGSTSNKPMVDIKNSPSGNTKGWVYDNYIGSINGNGLAISAVGANLFVNHNMITGFNNGIYFATQTGVCKGNIVNGYSGSGIQVASTAAGINNNAEVSGNILLSKTSGAVHGIILSGSVNGGTLTSNIVRGKHDYYVRLLSAYNFLVESNNLLPLYGAATSGVGVYEDDNCTGNVVKANNVQAAAKYRRYSFEYDDFYLTNTSLPASGVWKKGDIVKVPDPVAFGATGYICITAGTGAAAVWQKYGLITKQIPARPNVVASDLAALVAAHNTLLADLRAANIMMP